MNNLFWKICQSAKFTKILSCSPSPPHLFLFLQKMYFYSIILINYYPKKPFYTLPLFLIFTSPTSSSLFFYIFCCIFFFIFVIIFLILFLLLFFITFFITFYFYFNIHRWCRNNKTFCFVLKKSSPLSKTLCSFLVGKYFLII